MKRHIYFLGLLLNITTTYAVSLDAVVVEVNDGIITKSELDKNVADTKMQLEARHMAVPANDILRKQVLEHLIDVNLELQFAKNNNIDVSDDELDEIIKNIAVQNKITIEQLQAELAKTGLNWNDYKQTLKKEVIITRLQQGAVGRDIHISESQVNSYLKDALVEQEGQKKYHLLNIVVPLSEAPSPAEVAAAKQKADRLFDQATHGEDFSKLAIMESSDEYALNGGDLGERYLAELPQVFASVVIQMSLNDVKGPIRTGNGWQLIKLVGVNEEELHHKITKTHVKHILIKPGPQMTEVQAEHLIQNIHRQIQNGKAFDVLAKKYSVDAVTALKGGDMGWVVSNELVPQFAEVMDKLPISGISAPVKTPFGWHVMQVLERKEEDDSAAFQRQKIRAMLQQKRFSEAVNTWQKNLRAQAFIHIIDKTLRS
jgi:peptidyl-prolyl cis-trans isomerase SurA